MPETDRSRALGGLAAGALGAGLGVALILLAWGVMALLGDGEFPSGLLGAALMPAGGPMRSLWERRPVNRRPAVLVALLLLLLVVLFATALGDLYAEDSDGQSGLAQLLFGYVPGVLLFGTVFGVLCGESVDEPGRHWLRFTGRGGRFHLAVYGGLFALLVLTVAAIGASA
ncbi:hypothetical protein [Kitasatospora sp. NPDC048407]|uniref:hypothetical protein n=1 Tax=Kitasatospora sp. NPDC048407 TaxID=3364051 RepID=UPI003710B35F